MSAYKTMYDMLLQFNTPETVEQILSDEQLVNV